MPPAAPQPPAAPGPPPPLPPMGTPPAAAPAPYAPQYAPPGQVPPVGGAPHAPPAAAPKKSRAWLWVIVVAVLLLCCAGVAAVLLGGAAIFSGGSSQAATVAKADADYKLAADALTTLSTEASGLSAGDAAAMAAFKTKTDASLKTARGQLESARATIGTLSASEARTAYEQGIDETIKGLDALQALVEEAGGKTEFGTLAVEASKLYSEGSRKMNDAVGLMNKNLYSRAGVEAGRAKAIFKQAREKFVKADAMEPTADLEKVIVYIDLQLDKVGYVIQMANYGVKGETSAYNKAVPKFNAINTKISKSPEPTALNDPNWGTNRITELAKQVDDSMTKAAELLDKAHKLLSGSGG